MQPLCRSILMLLALTQASPAFALAGDCGVPSNGVPDESALSALGSNWAELAGLRPTLAARGVGLGATYYAELFGNPVGGFKRGADYGGVFELELNAALQKLGLWKGLCFHVNGFQIHDQGITAENIGGLMPVSSLEARPATRLDELWIEQHMFSDKLLVRIGQLAADTEFVLSEGGGNFLNSTWGWPAIYAADLPGGGPAYPLATPGVRVSLVPSDKAKLLIGLFNGDPADPNCPDDPQVCNPNGLDFRLDDPPLLLLEGSYRYSHHGLDGTIKLGGWNHFGDASKPFAIVPSPFENDFSLYAIVDQVVWQSSRNRSPANVAVFGRMMAAPRDRNLVDFYADGGLTFTGLVRDRPDDTLAIGLAYTALAGNGGDGGTQALFEFCYSWSLGNGFLIQPDLQYLWQADDGGTVNDGTLLKDSLVVGVRSTISF